MNESRSPGVSNVVLVTVDSLRADAVDASPAGDLTPTLGRLAADGLAFENAFAHGNWTPFSFPSVHASRPVFAASADIGLPETPTLAEVLRASGIRTGGFNAANGFLTHHWGYDRGFDEFESFVTGAESGPYSRYLAAHPTVQGWIQLATSPFRRAVSRLAGGSDDRPFADTSRMLDVERRASRFVRDADGPFFLWVHYMDAHTPYVPALRYLREVSSRRVSAFGMARAHVRTGLGREVGDRTLADLKTLYDAAVRQVDASVGRLLEALSEAGRLDDTCVVVAGDHGEEFLEHGHLAHYPKLYEELIHVPLLLWHPDLPAGRVEPHVGLDAIAPTVCDALGVRPAESWEGESVLPPFDRERSGERPPAVSVAVRGEEITQQPIPRRLDEGELLVSARTADWTYIEHVETGRRELYDRRADPSEQRNRYGDPADRPAVAARLESAVDEHASRLARNESAERETPNEIAARLKALGYR
ncbi:sulfatase [Halegenticoccus soli]|uniref:sulfatase n=1 Tax=Halegenticoccus soli TaxID=1985678 RepID=UPI000C6D5C5D|nr:sulfatase [Halegenticoccus soli]